VTTQLERPQKATPSYADPPIDESAGGEDIVWSGKKFPIRLRCRLFPSWSCSRGQGWGCSPIKGERELGLDRRETGRSLPDRGAVVWGEVAPSTRGTGQRSLWFISCPTGHAEQL